MSSNSSQNYEWNTGDVLGTGAAGIVLRGRHKITREAVAIKTFKKPIHLLSDYQKQIQEYEIMKKIDHENVVKLIAVEEDQQLRQVMVMELSTEGCLTAVLKNPENMHGLPDEEVLLVLKNLTAAIQHLRAHNLVHRDLKPDNILKFKDANGATIYKLSDFGAARELHDEQQFFTICGTEEYIHPSIFDAFLNKEDKCFGAEVELWSLGITLVQVITGNLPFRAFNGRRDRKTMYRIIKGKGRGCIMGVQKEENGPVEYSNALPEHCQLSGGLRKLMTELLGDLLEADQENMCSFEQFFAKVTRILSHIPLNVFMANSAKLLKIYIHSCEKYEQLQNRIYRETGVSADNQILFLQNNNFSQVVHGNKTAVEYPNTSENEPIILFDKQITRCTLENLSEIPEFRGFPQMNSLLCDAHHARFACSLGHLYKRKIERILLIYHLICKSASCFSYRVVQNLGKLYKNAESITPSSPSSYQAQAFQLLQINSNNFSILRASAKSIGESRNSYISSATEQINSLEDYLRQFQKDVNTLFLSHSLIEKHNFIKMQITGILYKLKALLKDCLDKTLLPFLSSFNDWYVTALNVYLKNLALTQKFENHVSNLQEQQKVNIKLNRIRSSKLKNVFKTFEMGKDETKRIIDANTFLMQKLDSLLESLDCDCES